MAKAYGVDGGSDSISRLTFTFRKSNRQERKLVYTMVWKDYGGKDNLEDKLVFFSEYPPDDRGKSFMTWIYNNKKADEWMYLPELRMVRKVTHSNSHRHDNEEDDFANSVLTLVDLVPRQPELDRHELLREDQLDGQPVYVIESVPRQDSDDYPYQRVQRWISRDDFLIERMDSYSKTGDGTKRQVIKWKKMGDAWVWEQVVGTDLKTQASTTLDISEIRVNNGLNDEVFSARSLRLGKDSITR